MKRPKPHQKRRTKPIIDSMHAVGTAVMTAQLFEAVFVMVARTALKHPHAIQMDDIAPFTAKAYKQPVSALLKELTFQDQIEAIMAERIFNLIEDRNCLVHRIFITRAAVLNVEDTFDDALVHLCRRIYAEAGALTADLLDLFFAYSKRFPEAAEYLSNNMETFESFARQIRPIRAKVFI